MASTNASISKGLPPLYNEVVPLAPENHLDLGMKSGIGYDFALNTNSFAIAIEEFSAVQQHYPILFTDTSTPMPAAFMSIEGDTNPYVQPDGTWRSDCYIPAYVRRYPFLLIRANKDSDDFALCFEQGAPHFGKDAEGKFFDGEGSTKLTKSILEFCVDYEKSLDKTRHICERLSDLELFTNPVIKLSKGGKSVQLKGFKTVDEQKLRKLPTDDLANLVASGVMAAIYAHLFSLRNIGQLEGLSNSLEKIQVN